MCLTISNEKAPHTTYLIASEIKWTVEMQGLLIVDDLGKKHWLPYPKAALWDLISRGHPVAKVYSMMAHIAALNPSSTEALIHDSLEEWLNLGLLLKG